MLLRCCWWLKREEKSEDFQPFFFPLYFCRPLLFSRALFLVTWPSGQNLYPGPYIPWLLLSTLHKNIQLLCNKGNTLICSLFSLPRTFLNPTRPKHFCTSLDQSAQTEHCHYVPALCDPFVFLRTVLLEIKEPQIVFWGSVYGSSPSAFFYRFFAANIWVLVLGSLSCLTIRVNFRLWQLVTTFDTCNLIIIKFSPLSLIPP